MAKATATFSPPVKPTGYVLDLSPEEAYSLALVSMRVGGPPSGRRGHIDSIRKALYSAGVPKPDYNRHSEDSPFESDSGGIYFKSGV